MNPVDVERFRRDGFAEIGTTLDEDGRAAILARFDELDAAARIPPGYQAQYDDAGGGRHRLRKLRRLVWNDRALFAPVLIRMGLVDLAETLIGPGAVLILHAAFLKPGRIGTPVAPHQDQALWNADHPGAFSTWTALTEVSPDNGGLHGYPGSHRNGVLPHRPDPDHPWHDTLSHATDLLGKRHEFVLRPGESVIWDRLFVHGSDANTSDRDRRGMVVVIADGTAEGSQARDVLPVRELRASAG